MREEIEKMEQLEQIKHMEIREIKLTKAMEKVITKQVQERNSLQKKLNY